jgi:Ca2+-transporting ATPase
MGRIGKALEAVPDEVTPLQREIRRVVRRIAIAALLFTAIVVILYGLTYGNWLDGLLAGITLAMAILPQEFPVVLTVFLALGAWRIAKQQVLTRHIPAVETLGSATMLCVDKTGTLTLNRMRVSRLYAGGEFLEVNFEGEEFLPEPFHEVVEYSILASEINPFDPMEKAFLELGNHFFASTEHLHPDWELVREYPLTAGLFAHAHAWRPRAGDGCVVATKGAPEAIAELCRLDAGHRQQLDARVADMAAGGLRVLAVARATYDGQAWPASQRDFDFDSPIRCGRRWPTRCDYATKRGYGWS